MVEPFRFHEETASKGGLNPSCPHNAFQVKEKWALAPTVQGFSG